MVQLKVPLKEMISTTKLAQAAKTGLEAARRPEAVELAKKGATLAKTVAQSLPYRELATMCGRAGAAGAIVDGAMGGVQAIKAVRDGRIDTPQAVKHTASEAGCGFVTSAAGTAGTLAAYMVTGAMGPLVLAAGMGASMGSRYVYRQIVGETLPEQGGGSGSGHNYRRQDDDDSVLEDIGPRG